MIIKTKQAQAVMADFFLATVVFMIILTAIIFTKNSYETRIHENLIEEELIFGALEVANVLVKTPGLPSNWEFEPDFVVMPGLASSDRILSTAKIDSFFDLNYSDIQDFMSMGNINLTLKDFNGVVIKSTGIAGPEFVSHFIRIERRVLYNDEKAILVVDVWAE